MLPFFRTNDSFKSTEQGQTESSICDIETNVERSNFKSTAFLRFPSSNFSFRKLPSPCVPMAPVGLGTTVWESAIRQLRDYSWEDESFLSRHPPCWNIK
jgi:hypothetical protein